MHTHLIRSRNQYSKATRTMMASAIAPRPTAAPSKFSVHSAHFCPKPQYHPVSHAPQSGPVCPTSQ